MIIDYDQKYFNQCLAIGRRMHTESRFARFNYSEEHIARLLNSNKCCVLLNVVEEEVRGFFVGVVTSQWFGPDLVGQDLGMYIDPEYRGGTTAMRFVKRFEQYCKQRGCRDIVLGSSAEIATETARRLYTGLGYKECGFIAHKEL